MTDRIDQVKLIPPVPGVAEHLATTGWHADGEGRRYGCDVTCKICELKVACHVMHDGSMSGMDRRFWIYHFQIDHTDKLPTGFKAEL